jgi:hypothetical protein
VSTFHGHSGAPGYARFHPSQPARRIEFCQIPMKRYLLMKKAAQMAMESAATGSLEALIIDVPKYEPIAMTLGLPTPDQQAQPDSSPGSSLR